MIPREAQVRDGANRNRVVAVAVGDHDRPLDDRLEIEDRNLRLVDDRSRDNRSVGPGAGNRKGAAAHVVGSEPVFASPAGEVADPLCETLD